MGSELNELIADVKEQVLYLQELGVETFDVKLADRFESLETRVESGGQRPVAASSSGYVMVSGCTSGVPAASDSMT